VDTPVGELTYDDKVALARFKPALLKVLSGGEVLRDDRPRLDAKPSPHPGYTRLYDPVCGEWHDFPTRDCYPSIVELASKNRGDFDDVARSLNRPTAPYGRSSENNPSTYPGG
jgi:hypothetical protein